MNSVLKMTDTEYDWIGTIPSHWTLKKIKYVFWDRKENNNPIKSENLISLTIEKGVIPHSEKTGGGNKPKGDLTKYKLVYPGDIVLNSMNVIAGAVGISKYFGVVSPVYYMLIPRELDHSNEYFHHLFRTETFQKSLYGLGNGILIKENEETGKLNTIRMRIPMEKLGDQFIPVPPAEEQKLIARYLDKKTEQIDRLVEKIQKKIELLKEQRTSLINQYVTKGLDPNVEMKDSGVEWIGEIPVHWNRVRVKNLVSTKITDGPHETPEFVDTGIPFLSVEGVVDNQIDFNRVRGFISKETHDVYSKKCKPRKDDILLVKSGSTTGKSTIVDTDLEFNIWSPLCILRSNIKKILPLFLFNSVQSSYFRTQIEMGWSYGTQPNIGMGVIENLWIFLPPIEEQKTMNLRLADLAKPIDVNVQKNIEKIELLKEYRQSIISSVVTGKVNVTVDML